MSEDGFDEGERVGDWLKETESCIEGSRIERDERERQSYTYVVYILLQDKIVEVKINLI